MRHVFGVRALFVVCIFTAAPAFAQEAAAIKIKETCVIDGLGDGKFDLEIKLPTVAYNYVKEHNPNTAVLLRRLGLAPGQ
jgi:hypothetical protein